LFNFRQLCIVLFLKDEGYTLHLLENDVVVHGAVVCLCGDIPASCHVGGFKEGVGFAMRKCRRCLATNVDIVCKVIKYVLLYSYIRTV